MGGPFYISHVMSENFYSTSLSAFGVVGVVFLSHSYKSVVLVLCFFNMHVSDDL